MLALPLTASWPTPPLNTPTRHPATTHPDLGSRNGGTQLRANCARGSSPITVCGCMARCVATLQIFSSCMSNAAHLAHLGVSPCNQTPWKGIAHLYQQINAHFPTEGSRVAGAIASGEAGDIPGALRQLDQMDPQAMQNYQPWWVARAYLLSRDGPARRSEADKCYQTAIGLTVDPKIKKHLESERQVLWRGAD